MDIEAFINLCIAEGGAVAWVIKKWNNLPDL
jgi:hypothetical protein